MSGSAIAAAPPKAAQPANLIKPRRVTPLPGSALLTISATFPLFSRPDGPERMNKIDVARFKFFYTQGAY